MNQRVNTPSVKEIKTDESSKIQAQSNYRGKSRDAHSKIQGCKGLQ
jgi:hypothetical protein